MNAAKANYAFNSFSVAGQRMKKNSTENGSVRFEFYRK